MFLKHYCVCWECFNDVLKTSLKNVKLRYLKNICMMFLKFYITFYLHLQNVIEKCFRYNMYITFIKCYKNVMCLLGLRHPLRCGYNELVDIVNAELRRLISFFPRIHFWKHRGMLFDYRSLVSDDGVHLSPVGDRLFYRSIRGAALFLSKH